MRPFVPLIVSLLLLAGCGQKGPLYLPDDVKRAHAEEQAAEAAARNQAAPADPAK
ncbi:MAG: lipoprotein [Gammaproteobacteria bacterium]|nr:lipoprotein [Gammaproteobacteria bacterium]